MDLLLQLLLILILITSLLLLLQKPTKRVHKEPPGPLRLPLIGNLHQLTSSSPHLFFYELSKKYGPIISLKLGFRPTLVISSAKMAKEVMKTQDHAFCSRPKLASMQRLSYNGLDIAFATYGDNWRDFKKVCTLHLLSTKKVKSFSWVREEEVCNVMKKISSLSHEGVAVDLSEMIYRLTISVICRIAIGRKYDDGRDASCRPSLRKLINDLDEMFVTSSFSDYFHGMSWIDRFTGMKARLDKVFKECDEFYEEVIKEHLNTIRNRAKSDQEDIVDVLLRIQMEESLGFDVTNDHIKALLMNVFLGATSTGAATIIWAMTELMKNPNAMKRLQEETRTIVMGNKTTDNVIKAEDFEKLMYLKAVVKETMRLHPAGPILVPRETIQKCTIEEYEIQENTLVYVNAWAIGRDPEFWEHHEEFIPERFLGDRVIDFRGQDFGLIPFGSGRRICPGIQMGIAMVELTLVNLICLFDWKLPAGMEKEALDMSMSTGLAVHKKIPLRLVAKNFCC